MTVDDLKAMIRMNVIKNNMVTTKDINLAERAFGPDIATIKSVTTHQKPDPVVDQQIEIPEELLSLHEAVTLSIDGLTVNGLKSSTTTSSQSLREIIMFCKKLCDD